MEQANTLREAKASIRRRMIHRRLDLSAQEVRQAGEIIQQGLLQSRVYADAAVIMCYAACRHEVGTDIIIAQALADGKCTCLPVTIPEGRRLLACRITHPDRDLRPDAFGIPSPPYPGAEVVPLDKIQLIIVPGLAFDGRGYRLGYGGGYYDRLLSLSHSAVTVGLAYDFQLLDELPVADYDIGLDILITEHRTVKINPRLPNCSG